MRNFKFNSLSAIIRSKKARRGMTIVICVFASLVLLITTAGAAGTAAKAVNVIMDGIKYPLTKGHPYSENGTTMIPFRMISGKLGTQANWNAANKTLTLQQKRKQNCTDSRFFFCESERATSSAWCYGCTKRWNDDDSINRCL